MKWLFKKKAVADPPKENIISGIANTCYNHLQKKWVGWMEYFTAGFSAGNLKAMLLIFVVVVGSYSVFLIARSFTPKAASVFTINHTRKPEHITETGETQNFNKQVTANEYRRLQKFRSYMDSLKRSPNGKATYDRIIRQHPGLMDSLQTVENYYSSRFKNEK